MYSAYPRVSAVILGVAIGRRNYLFAGADSGGERAAAIMSLIRSSQLNGHDPHVYLKDVLVRLPTHRAADIDALLPIAVNPTQAHYSLHAGCTRCLHWVLT
jgi:hypothetical protein